MPKKIYCSKCGVEINCYPKVLRSPQRVVNLIDPHECGELAIPTTGAPSEPDIVVEGPSVTEERKKDEKAHLDFDSVLTPKTVKKFNELEEVPPDDIAALSAKSLGDRRSPEHLRKEKTSSAPSGILNQVKLNTPSTPEGDISEEPEGGD